MPFASHFVHLFPTSPGGSNRQDHPKVPIPMVALVATAVSQFQNL
jgi:hypothetical protein